MKKQDLQIGQIIKLGHDTFKVTSIRANTLEGNDEGFNAVRMIKTRKVYGKTNAFIRFVNLERCEIV